MLPLFLALVTAATASPHADVAAALDAFNSAVSSRDYEETRRLLHPSSVQVVQMKDAEMVLSVDDYIAAMKAGKVGGAPIEAAVANITVTGKVATASAVRRIGAFQMVDAVALAQSDDGWRIVAMAVQADPVDEAL